jgi:sortase A
MMKAITLRRFNNGLATLVICLGLYLAVAPFAPKLMLWWRSRSGPLVPYSGKLSGQTDRGDKQPIPKDNRLVVPRLRLNEAILEGKSLSVLDHNGVWRRPTTSNDPGKGNMVIIGHRFMYRNPSGTFYNLDKMKPGDSIGIYWHGKEYVYRVIDTRELNPHDVTVEAPTDQPQLTLYTCTPLVTAKNRLVVRAKRIDLWVQ